MRVLHRTADSTRMLVAFPTFVVQQMPSGMPLATEYLMLASKSMRQSRNNEILSAKLSAAQAHGENQTAAADPAIIRALNLITGDGLANTLKQLTTSKKTRKHVMTQSWLVCNAKQRALLRQSTVFRVQNLR